MYGIITGLVTLLEDFIQGRTTLAVEAPIGAQKLEVTSRRYYFPQDQIIISHPTLDVQEKHTVCDWLTDRGELPLTDGVTSTFPAGSTISKVYNGVQVQDIFAGDPPIKERFPSIAVEIPSSSEVPFTLESISQEITVLVHCYVDTTNYSESFELLHRLTAKIRDSLFVVLYPLFEPFNETTLAEPVTASDNTIKLTEEITFFNGFMYFESGLWRRANRVINRLGNSVYELAFAVGRPFPAGTRVFQPLSNAYDCRPISTDFEDVQSRDLLLKRSTIEYVCKIERRRLK